MRRGDIVIAVAPGFGKKPRPFVILQAASYEHLTTRILIPLSSTIAEPALGARVRIEPSAENGLYKVCDATVALPVTARVDRIDKQIGKLSPRDLARVEQAALVVLGFGEGRSA